MSRFFFNLAGDPPVDDPEGMELPDVEAARQHAIAVAHALMQRTKIFREDQARWAVQVTDDNGHQVLAVPFSEASMLAVNGGQRSDRAAFDGQLGWKVQLHIGKQIAATYGDVLVEELPEQFGVLLERLRNGRQSEDK